jgi:hypothetical protein
MVFQLEDICSCWLTPVKIEKEKNVYKKKKYNDSIFTGTLASHLLLPRPF